MQWCNHAQLKGLVLLERLTHSQSESRMLSCGEQHTWPRGEGEGAEVSAGKVKTAGSCCALKAQLGPSLSHLCACALSRVEILRTRGELCSSTEAR